MTLYLAGPLFSRSEKDFNQSIAQALRSKRIDVLLPQEFTSNIAKDSNFFDNAFKACIEGIDRAHVLVAILDGPDADSGTCFEVGYAFSKGLPIIAVRTDFRASEKNGVNLMLAQSATVIIEDFESTVDQLTDKIEAELLEIAKRFTSATGLNLTHNN